MKNQFQSPNHEFATLHSAIRYFLERGSVSRSNVLCSKCSGRVTDTRFGRHSPFFILHSSFN
jgi:hypothetical protein